MPADCAASPTETFARSAIPRHSAASPAVASSSRLSDSARNVLDTRSAVKIPVVRSPVRVTAAMAAPILWRRRIVAQPPLVW